MSSGDGVAVVEAIQAALPLRVDEVRVTDPVLTLSGREWSLTVWCPFRVTGLDFDWESEDLADRAWDLIGHDVQGLATTTAGPIFDFGDGVQLVLEEGDEWEPWVLRIPGLVVTDGTRSPHWS